MPELARCAACSRLKRVGSGCSLTHLDGRERIIHGWEWRAEGDKHDGRPCADCGVVTGQYHHPGCTVARCGACGRVEHGGPCP